MTPAETAARVNKAENEQRIRFVERLSLMTEEGRWWLLRIETKAELAALWNVAMAEKLTGVAASIEVEPNNRDQF